MISTLPSARLTDRQGQGHAFIYKGFKSEVKVKSFFRDRPGDIHGSEDLD